MEKQKRIITAKEIIEEQKRKAQQVPQELRKGIDDIKGIYSDELIEYLEALLSFEVNIVNDNTCNEERLEVLKRLKLFRRLVDYNVFEHTKKIIEQTDERIDIIQRYFEYFPNFFAKYKASQENIKTLFRTNFINVKGGSKISFTIYKIENNEEKRKQRLEELYDLYKKEEQVKNPIIKDIDSNDEMRFLTNPYIKWEQQHEEKLQYYRTFINELEARKTLNEKEQIEADIEDKIYNNLKKEYGPFNEEQGIIESSETEIKETITSKETPFVNIYTIKKYY